MLGADALFRHHELIPGFQGQRKERLHHLELTLDVLEHCHWVWTSHSRGNYCRARDLSWIGNIHLSVQTLSHSLQGNPEEGQCVAVGPEQFIASPVCGLYAAVFVCYFCCLRCLVKRTERVL